MSIFAQVVHLEFILSRSKSRRNRETPVETAFVFECCELESSRIVRQHHQTIKQTAYVFGFCLRPRSLLIGTLLVLQWLSEVHNSNSPMGHSLRNLLEVGGFKFRSVQLMRLAFVLFVWLMIVDSYFRFLQLFWYYWLCIEIHTLCFGFTFLILLLKYRL